MDRTKVFFKKLGHLSKPICSELILNIGLKIKDERILFNWYIEELNIYQIAEIEHLQKESAYNALSAARKNLYRISVTQIELLPDGLKNIIKYLLRN